MSRNTLGVVLIVIGLFVAMSNLGWIGSGWALFLIGGGFIAVYAARGGPRHNANVGLLIPGSILVMIGAYVSLTEAFDWGDVSGSLFFICLSVAFFGVFFIHTRRQAGAARFWPAITGGSILAFGLLVLSVEAYDSQTGRMILNHATSVGLVAAGIFILWGSRRKKTDD